MVDTVVNQEGRCLHTADDTRRNSISSRLVGHSTDWIGAKGGLRAILSDGGAAIAPEKLSSVLVMGAGAAGHSVIYALLQLGAERIMVAFFLTNEHCCVTTSLTKLYAQGL